MDFASVVREWQLAMDDMQGGTLTITNGGTFGSFDVYANLLTTSNGYLGMQ